MQLDENPLTYQLHKYQRDKILLKFPQISTESKIPLFFWKYLDNKPEKFYSNEILDISLSIFKRFLDEYPDDLVNFLKDQNNELNLSFRQLRDINSLPIHDNPLSKDKLELIKFCDNSILPAYLKLIEGVFHVLINPIVAYSRLEKGKQIVDLPLHNRIENIENTYRIFIEPISLLMRNGIAHGGVVFGDNDITFVDNRGNTEKHWIQDVISIFDNLLDTCNAIMLAYILFYNENGDFFKNKNILLPITVIYEELKSELKSPGWDVKGCIESKIFNGKNQLNIFTQNSFRDQQFLMFHILRTIWYANHYAPFYNRYFLKLSSKHYIDGFIAFDGVKIKELQENANLDDISNYSLAIETPLVWHRKMPFFKIYSIIYSLILSVKITIPLEYKKIQETNYDFNIETRFIDINTNRYTNKARLSILINNNTNIELDTLIRENIKKILKQSIHHAKKDLSYLSLAKYLPISFIHINILLKDFRKRKIAYPGLIPELICTIEQDKTGTIKIIDIATGIPEVIGNIRLVWNQKSGYPKNKPPHK